MDIKLDAVQSMRKVLNTALEKEGVKISVNDFVVKASALVGWGQRGYAHVINRCEDEELVSTEPLLYLSSART